MAKAPDRIEIIGARLGPEQSKTAREQSYMELRMSWVTGLFAKTEKVIGELKKEDGFNLNFGSGERSRRIRYKVVQVYGDGFALEREK